MTTAMMTTAMTSTLTNWLSLTAMQSLGWALLHFLWQGTALAALSAAAMALCRRASARYLVGVAALALMLLAPLATFFFYSQQFNTQPHSGVADTTKSSPLAASALSSTAMGRVAGSGPTHSSTITTSRPLPWKFEAWLVEAWLLGVAFFSLRSAGGFLLLERERRRQSTVVSSRVLETCLTLQHQLGLDRAIAYCECAWLQAPAVIGWFRPVVFLPVTALSGLTEEQLALIIAHELAHIRRFDPFVNVFQVCVETLLFYHPAVWWLNKRIRVEREHCCDDMAVALCGNAIEYARALTLMEEWRSAPALENSGRWNARHRTDRQRPVSDRCTRCRECAAWNGASFHRSRGLDITAATSRLSETFAGSSAEPRTASGKRLVVCVVFVVSFGGSVCFFVFFLYRRHEGGGTR
jgi:beta-lactamase regulating signal transducer with metallopeptidase domain